MERYITKLGYITGWGLITGSIILFLFNLIYVDVTDVDHILTTYGVFGFIEIIKYYTAFAKFYFLGILSGSTILILNKIQQYWRGE